MPQIETPYGKLPMVYADFTASGTPYPSIEKFIDTKVLPYYSNVHSNAHNGQLMAEYIRQSKEYVKKSLNCKPCDKVIFTGSGCSGAIVHLIHILNLRIETKPKTTVYISEAEHHSNHLPWKHLPVNLVIVKIKSNGLIDLDYLFKDALKRKGPIVCSFIAGSNVTGVIQPFYDTTRKIRKTIPRSLVFWDFAGCGPYVKIDMHKKGSSHFDGIMMSPHKMTGGPGTPGLLVINQKVFKNEEPYCPGGGTVRFVSKDFVHYSSNKEARETGGTPNIIGSIKLGLCFQLKDSRIEKIISRNKEIVQRVNSFIKRNKKIHCLNTLDGSVDMFPVYSFVVPGFHYNLIVALFNDLYGIQTRGGVSCCSLYAQKLLKINKRAQNKIYSDIVHNKGVPSSYGWCRISFHYSMSDRKVDFILKALEQIYDLAPVYSREYKYDEVTNNWVHKKFKKKPPVLSLFK